MLQNRLTEEEGFGAELQNSTAEESASKIQEQQDANQQLNELIRMAFENSSPSAPNAHVSPQEEAAAKEVGFLNLARALDDQPRNSALSRHVDSLLQDPTTKVTVEGRTIDVRELVSGRSEFRNRNNHLNPMSEEESRNANRPDGFRRLYPRRTWGTSVGGHPVTTPSVTSTGTSTGTTAGTTAGTSAVGSNGTGSASTAFPGVGRSLRQGSSVGPAPAARSASRPRGGEIRHIPPSSVTTGRQLKDPPSYSNAATSSSTSGNFKHPRGFKTNKTTRTNATSNQLPSDLYQGGPSLQNKFGQSLYGSPAKKKANTSATPARGGEAGVRAPAAGARSAPEVIEIDGSSPVPPPTVTQAMASSDFHPTMNPPFNMPPEELMQQQQLLQSYASASAAQRSRSVPPPAPRLTTPPSVVAITQRMRNRAFDENLSEEDRRRNYDTILAEVNSNRQLTRTAVNVFG